MVLITFKEYLVEDRLDFLKQKYKNIYKEVQHDHHAPEYSDRIIEFWYQRDPSPNKKYTDWILNRYKQGKFRMEDSQRVRDTIHDFMHFQDRLPEKDINKYKDLIEIRDAVRKKSHEIVTASDNAPIDHAGAKKIYDKNGLVIYKILSLQAARFYAEGTEWCTKARDMYEEYSGRGPLYIVFTEDKHNKTWYKYQFHLETSQFMDIDDREVDLKDFIRIIPEIHNIPEWQGRNPLLTNNTSFNNKKIFYYLVYHDATGMVYSDPRFDRKHLLWILSDEYDDYRIEQKPYDINAEERETLFSLLHNNLIDESILLHILDLKNDQLKLYAIQCALVTRKVLEKALHDESSTVRLVAQKILDTKFHNK